MIDTDKYEGHTEGPWVATQIKRSEYPDEYIIESGDGMLMTGFVGLGNDGVNAKLMADAPLLLAEVKRLREENEMLREELKNDDTGIKAIDGLLKAVGDRNEEVKRLREENNRYLDFILWLGIEHKGKKLAWEYGDEKIVEML